MNEFAERRHWGPKPKYDRVKAYQRPNNDFIVIAGPCSVESKEQIHEIAKIAADRGATHLRGGVYRAGTYPGENSGLVGRELLEAYYEAATANGLKNIIEVLDVRLVTTLVPYCHAFQVGARQMQNYSLLKVLGTLGGQIFLKRNVGSPIDEFLGAAEHLLAAETSESDVHPVLIERGSSTYHNHVRWDLSISMIPAVQAITQIPIIVDASHGTGRRDLVEPMTLAGVAAGANGVLLEVHTNPKNSLSDADQAISPEDFHFIMANIKRIKMGVV